MWNKRASKNRRLGREFVLDVKLRSSQVRAKRFRMAAVALGSIFAAVAAVFLTRIYVGAHLPLDMVGGAALGVAVGALVRLALGVPTGPPDPADDAAAFAPDARKVA